MKRKFTLLELLIVIAVIGILITLLLPALSKSRYLAKFAVCKSNNSQITKGLYLYSNMNNRMFPKSESVGTKPKYHRYAWHIDRSTGALGKLIESDILTPEVIYCPQANETAVNSKFKMSQYLNSDGGFNPSIGDATRTPYIFLPYENKLKSTFVDSLESDDYLVGSTFLSKNEIFHDAFGVQWNVGLLNGAVGTSRSKTAYNYLFSNYAGGNWSKAEYVRDSLLPK